MSIKTFPSQYDVDNNGGNLNSEQNLVSWMTANVPGIPSTAEICGSSSQQDLIIGTPGTPSNRRYFGIDLENSFQLSKTGNTVTISGGTIVFEGYLITVDDCKMVNPTETSYRCSIIVPIEKTASDQPPIKSQPKLIAFQIQDSTSNSEIPFSENFDDSVIQSSKFLELPILGFDFVNGQPSLSSYFIKEFRINLNSVGSNITVGANDESSLQEILDKTIEMIQAIWGTNNWQTPAIDPDNNELQISLTQLVSRSPVRSKIVSPLGEEQSGIQYLPFLVQQSEENNQNYELNIGYLPKADGTNKMGVVQINDVISPGVNTGTLSVVNGILSTTAEVNQNAWSIVGYGTTPSQISYINSSAKEDTINIVSDGTISLTGDGKTLTVRVLKVPENSEQVFKSLTLKDSSLVGDTMPNAALQISKGIGGWVLNVNGNEIGRITVSSSGSPVLKLTGDTEVTGNSSVGGNLTVTGTITGSKVYNAVYNDAVEFFEKENYEEEINPGDVLCVNEIGLCRKILSRDDMERTIGVCSSEETYGYALGGHGLEDNQKVPVGMFGRVMVKTHDETISSGDLLISNEDGTAVKMTNYSKEYKYVLGMATKSPENGFVCMKIR